MTTPYYTDDHVTLWHGDCLDVLRGLPDGSVDAVVTDPPYNLGFMGQAWDRPGSAARGYRSDQELATNPYSRARAEYDGSGFPKSLDVSKAIDKAAGGAHPTAPATSARCASSRPGAPSGPPNAYVS